MWQTALSIYLDWRAVPGTGKTKMIQSGSLPSGVYSLLLLKYKNQPEGGRRAGLGWGKVDTLGNGTPVSTQHPSWEVLGWVSLIPKTTFPAPVLCDAWLPRTSHPGTVGTPQDLIAGVEQHTPPPTSIPKSITRHGTEQPPLVHTICFMTPSPPETALITLFPTVNRGLEGGWERPSDVRGLSFLGRTEGTHKEGTNTATTEKYKK